MSEETDTEEPTTEGLEDESQPDDSLPSEASESSDTTKKTIARRLDDILYRGETIVVVTALVAMSVFVFTDVAYQLAISMSQAIGASSVKAMIQLGAILGFLGLMAFAATGRDEEDDPEAMAIGPRVGIAVGTVLGCFGIGYALLNLESATVYRIVLVALSVPAIYVLKDDRKKLIPFIISALIGFFIFGRLPSGFSWAQSYSLVLLLWVGFLGASIAARERRHLRVDLMRKLCPEKYLAHFNAVSYLVAASFTTVVLYLGYIYMFGPESSYLKPIWEAPMWLPEGVRTTLETGFPLPDNASFFRRAAQVLFAPSEPGELPDWLKAAAIPVSMFLIAIRFLGHSIGFAMMAARGETFSENLAEGH